MRHGDKQNNLGRTSSHRKALLRNMANQLIANKRMVTTQAKAKALRTYVEPLINRSKSDTMHNRRVVFSYLQEKESIKELFGVIGDKVANRPGGYTRIIKLAPRLGDAAEMAFIELVDFNETYNKDAGDDASKKTRRSRRGGKKAATDAAESDTVLFTEAAKEVAQAEQSISEDAATDSNEDVTTENPTEEGDKKVD